MDNYGCNLLGRLVPRSYICVAYHSRGTYVRKSRPNSTSASGKALVTCRKWGYGPPRRPGGASLSSFLRGRVSAVEAKVLLTEWAPHSFPAVSPLSFFTEAPPLASSAPAASASPFYLPPTDQPPQAHTAGNPRARAALADLRCVLKLPEPGGLGLVQGPRARRCCRARPCLPGSSKQCLWSGVVPPGISVLPGGLHSVAPLGLPLLGDSRCDREPGPLSWPLPPISATSSGDLPTAGHWPGLRRAH